MWSGMPVEKITREGVEDVMVWRLADGGTFSIKSFYPALAGCH